MFFSSKTIFSPNRNFRLRYLEAEEAQNACRNSIEVRAPVGPDGELIRLNTLLMTCRTSLLTIHGAIMDKLELGFPFEI